MPSELQPDELQGSGLGSPFAPATKGEGPGTTDPGSETTNHDLRSTSPEPAITNHQSPIGNSEPPIVKRQSSTDNPEPRARRRYTASDRSRQASRRNLALAREVWYRLRRAPGFKPSAKQKAAAHGGLLRAVALKLRDCSLRYAGRFRHGLRAVSLERSLALAGETLADYQAHLRWCCGVLGQGYEATSEAMKLVLGFAYASWRRLRGLRTLAEWEWLAMCGTLRRCAARRRLGVEHGAEGLVSFIRLVRGVLGEQFFLIPKLKQVENRLEALAVKVVEERGGKPLHARARPSAVVDQHERYPAEVLGNPLVAAEKVMAALKRREARVKPPGEWEGWKAGTGVNWAEVLGAECHQPPDDSLLRQAREREAEGRLELPATFEEFLKLVQDAVGEGEPRVASGKPGVGAEGSPASTQNSGFGNRQSSIVNGQSPDAAVVREVAQELWRRLGMYRAQAEHEAEALRDLREAYPTSLRAEPDLAGAGDTAGSGGEYDSSDLCAHTRYLVAEMLSVEAVVGEAKAAEYRLDCALYRLLVERYGERPEFEELKPREPDYIHLLITAMMLNAHGNKAAAVEVMEEYYKLTALAEACLPPPLAPCDA
ncbi:MAG TPA: hypothetical protein VL523_19935 [Terriglobia bacterium]|nr:hypothetical protein [Terriglobia bacterium]